MEVRKGYKQTEVGMIPDDWDVASLSGVCRMKSGEGITSADIDEFSKYPCYGGNGLRGFTNHFTHDGQYALIGRQGALCGNVVGAEGKFFASEHAVVVTPFEQTDIHWLTYVLGDMRLNQYSESSAQPGLSVLKLLKLNIAFPSNKTEQRAIAAALSDVDSLLTALDALIAKKRLIKQGTMQGLLTGRKRLHGFTTKWEVKKIGEITRTTAGGTPSTLIDSYWGGEIKWMSSGELHLKRVYDVEGRITEEGLKNSSTSIIPPKCVLIGLAGQGKTRGTVAINMVELCTNQSIAAILPSSAFIPEYLYFNFDSRYDELRSISTGDGGRGGLNLTLINKMDVPLPPLPEQIAIAEILSDMDAEIAALKARREKTSLIKQGMMQELLTGKIRLV